MKQSILLASLFLFAAMVKAQNVQQDTIEWTAVKAINQKDNSEQVYNSSFVTNSNKSIDWIQKKTLSHYTIVDVSGEWSDLTQDGSITCNITGVGTLTGSLTFTKSQGQITIHLITMVEDEGLDYIFQVSSIQAR